VGLHRLERVDGGLVTAFGVGCGIRDDVIAECDTLIADIPVRSRDNLRNLVWRLATK